jgi:hypothetical protein
MPLQNQDCKHHRQVFYLLSLRLLPIILPCQGYLFRRKIPSLFAISLQYHAARVTLVILIWAKRLKYFLFWKCRLFLAAYKSKRCFDSPYVLNGRRLVFRQVSLDISREPSPEVAADAAWTKRMCLVCAKLANVFVCS